MHIISLHVSVHERSAVRISGSWLDSLPEDNFGTKILLSAMTSGKKLNNANSLITQMD